jgi:Tfp pilus assembly protein PilO
MTTLKLKDVDRICFAASAVIVLICGYWLASLSFRQEKLYQQQKDLLIKQTNDVNVAEKNIEQLKATTRATAEQLASLNRQLPEDAQIGLFLKQLDSLMKVRGVVLISIQPQSVIREKLFQKIPIRVSCKGPFVNLYRLLQDLDTMDRLVVMDRATMVKLDQLGYCQLDMTALIFMKESQQSGNK